nr:hypothetical protein [Paraburkholderia sp. UYCP14C]
MQGRPTASLALHRDHDAARRCMSLGDQRPIAGIVVPILNRLHARKFDNYDAAWPLPFEHFMCASFGEIASAMPFAVLDEVTNVTTWAAQNRDKFAEATSAAIGMDVDAVRVAIDRSDLTVGPVTRAIAAQLQETADVFLKLGFIPKPIVVRDAVWPIAG